MKKTSLFPIFAIASLMTATSAFAEVQSPQKAQAPQQQAIPAERFAEVKSMLLKNLREQADRMPKIISCVEKAKDPAEIQQCSKFLAPPPRR